MLSPFLEAPLLLRFDGGDLVHKKRQIKRQKLSSKKNLTLKLEEQANQPECLTKYFSGIKKGDFYEEPVQGEFPDW